MPNTALKAVEPVATEREQRGAIMENVIAKGDLAQLKPDERARYYMEVCGSLGINPLVKPFEYITLNGKLTLYATRTATDQLRDIKGVSIEIIDRRREDDLYIVVARATMSGRMDESTGAVNVKGLQGDALANAYMKAETKAKRRVTLSICGLGWMDETEAGSVPGAQIVPVDTETGVILEVASSEETPAKATPDQIQKLHGEGKSRGLDHDDLHALAGLKGYASIAEMTGDQITTMTTWLKSVRPAELDVYLKRAGRPTIDERLAAAK